MSECSKAHLTRGFSIGPRIYLSLEGNILWMTWYTKLEGGDLSNTDGQLEDRGFHTFLCPFESSVYVFSLILQIGFC